MMTKDQREPPFLELRRATVLNLMSTCLKLHKFRETVALADMVLVPVAAALWFLLWDMLHICFLLFSRF